jgi:hypothetical protein
MSQLETQSVTTRLSQHDTLVNLVTGLTMFYQNGFQNCGESKIMFNDGVMYLNVHQNRLCPDSTATGGTAVAQIGRSPVRSQLVSVDFSLI